MSVEKGDFILIDYVTKIKETGETFDTTDEEEAKQGGIYKDDAQYEPMLVVVGEGWVLQELDQSLIGLELKEPTIIEIPPEKGFGLRDPSKIRMVPIRRFRGKNVNLYPGAQVEVDGNMATVRSVGSGRVQLDLNPPLAGKTLVYDLTIKSRITKNKEKIQALIHRRIPTVDIQKVAINRRAKKVSIELPEESLYLEGVQYAKRGIASDILSFLPTIDQIAFLENFQRTTPEPVGEDEPQQESVQEDIESDQ